MTKYALIILLMVSCSKTTPPVAIIEDSIPTFKLANGTVIKDGRYNSFGNVVYINNSTVSMVYRSGLSHLESGEIRRISYNTSTATWFNPEILFVPNAGEDFRDPRLGIMNNGRYILFTSRMNSIRFIDMGYFLSNDSGKTWSSYFKLPLPPGVDQAITYGKIIPSQKKGTYYAAAYGYDDALVNWKTWLWEINASGAITKKDIYSGSAIKINESAMETLGDGRLMVISRAEETNRLYQFTSTDDGLSWSNAQETNIGLKDNINPSVPDLLYLNGSVYLSLMDRAGEQIKVSKSIPSEVFNNSKAWSPVYYADNKNLGYPSACKIANGKGWLLVWSCEISPTSAEMYFKVNE